MATSAPELPAGESGSDQHAGLIVPPDQLDEDARAAAEGELSRLDLAQSYTPEDVGSGVERVYQPPAPLIRGYAGDRVERPRAPERMQEREVAQPSMGMDLAAPPKQARTLEELYGLFPEIGNGVTRLRVERKAPKTWSGQNVSGVLVDLDEQITLDQFRDKFGGHHYTVSVIGPVRGRAKDDQQVPLGILASVRVDIPGPPALGTTPPAPTEEEDYMLSRSSPAQYSPRTAFLADSSVEIKKLDLEAEREKRRDQERAETAARLAATATPQESVIGAISEQAQRAVTEIKESSTKFEVALREQAAYLIEQLNDRDKELRVLRDEIVRVKTEATDQLRNGETKLVSEAKERHLQDTTALRDRLQGEINELKERYNRDLNETKERSRSELDRIQSTTKSELEQVRATYETRLNDMSRTNVEKLADERNRTQKELEVARTDYRERLESLKNDYARTEATLREEQRVRIAELERSNDRELRSIKESTERDLAMMRAQSTNETKLTERTSALQVQTMKDEIARLELRLERSDTENRELQRKVNKSVPEAIQEAHQLAGLTGMINREDAEPAGTSEDGALDWKQMGLKLGMTLLEKSPALLEALRTQNAAAAAARAPQAPPQARQLAPAPQGAPQMVRQPAPVQQQQRRVAPPPGMGGPLPPPHWRQGPNVPPPPGSTSGMPTPFTGQPVMEPPASMARPPIGSFGHPSPGPAPVPAQTGYAQPAIASPLQPAPEPQAAAGDVPQQWMPAPGHSTPPPPAVALVTTAVPAGAEEQGALIQEFVQELNSAIVGQVMPPGVFASAFIGRVGPDLARQLLQGMPADAFLEGLMQIPGADQLQIVTRDGHKYVRAVWQAGAQALGVTL